MKINLIENLRALTSCWFNTPSIHPSIHPLINLFDCFSFFFFPLFLVQYFFFSITSSAVCCTRALLSSHTPAATIFYCKRFGELLLHSNSSVMGDCSSCCRCCVYKSINGIEFVVEPTSHDDDLHTPPTHTHTPSLAEEEEEE